MSYFLVFVFVFVFVFAFVHDSTYMDVLHPEELRTECHSSLVRLPLPSLSARLNILRIWIQTYINFSRKKTSDINFSRKKTSDINLSRKKTPNINFSRKKTKQGNLPSILQGMIQEWNKQENVKQLKWRKEKKEKKKMSKIIK